MKKQAMQRETAKQTVVKNTQMLGKHMKKIQGIYSAPGQHWVGDGFPVRSLFSYDDHGRELSPFLLLDYAGPTQFTPTNKPRGVGVHPHRGFETVTIVYQGEVDHRDSAGGGGHIGPGDVQWMTAASGILHEEYHSVEFTRNGGMLEMVQLWVNLPAQDKWAAPRYQTLLKDSIPQIKLAEGAGKLRIIAGHYQDSQGQNYQGPALTFSPLNVWDLKLNADYQTPLLLSEGHTLAIVVLQGEVRLNEDERVRAAELAILAREGDTVLLHAETDARVLILSGEPLDEPVVGYGPFVMNTQQEIAQALRDFNEGRFVQREH